MRLFRVLFVALLGVFAVIAGLFTAAAVSLGAIVVMFVMKLLRQPTRNPIATERRPQFSRPRAGDVIDITATEVPADSAHR